MTLALLVAGCGSSFSSASDGGGADGATEAGAEAGVPDSGFGGGPDAGADAISPDSGTVAPGCPAKEPGRKASCAPVNLVCEYGGKNNPVCNTRYTCTADGWSAPLLPSPDKDVCPDMDGECLGYGVDSADNGSPCTINELECAYMQGTCICALGMTETLTFMCIPASGACPSPRPSLGEACSGNAVCAYGPCIGGIQLECEGGYWYADMPACAVKGGS